MIDTHCHLNDETYKDKKSFILDAKKEGVDTFLCVGWDYKSSVEAINLSKEFKEVYAAVGIHPSDISKMSKDDFLKIEELLADDKVIAIGEIGLDYHYPLSEEEKNDQITYFNKFIDLANKHDLPIIVHSRDAIELTYQILSTNKVKRGGIIHCYSANKYYVDKYVKLGFYFGVGGVVTFKNATTLKEAVKVMPIDRILLETDCPYMAPTPFRGQCNHSKYLPLIAKEISSIKEVVFNKIIENTNKSFNFLFRVKH